MSATQGPEALRNQRVSRRAAGLSCGIVGNTQMHANQLERDMARSLRLEAIRLQLEAEQRAANVLVFWAVCSCLVTLVAVLAS